MQFYYGLHVHLIYVKVVVCMFQRHGYLQHYITINYCFFTEIDKSTYLMTAYPKS